MAIKKSLVAILKPAKLIKEEIPKPIMDQAVAIKLEYVGLMSWLPLTIVAPAQPLDESQQSFLLSDSSGRSPRVGK